MAKQTIHDLKLDTMNFNRHTDEGLQMIQKSLTQNGFGRSVCVDRDNNVMSGNGVVESAMALGKEKIKIVETTGDELVVVKRTDLTINSKEGRDLAMADNAVAELNWDFEALAKAKEMFNVDIADWGGQLQEQEKEEKKKATELLSELKHEDIYYQPKIKPLLKLEDCINLDKFHKKIKALEEYDLTQRQKDILTLFAYRFIRIDFESVANYYAFNATPEEQKAMERLRLVLVDGSIDGFINDDILKIANKITDFTKDAEE